MDSWRCDLFSLMLLLHVVENRTSPVPGMLMFFSYKYINPLARDKEHSRFMINGDTSCILEIFSHPLFGVVDGNKLQ
ncbi:hypothetical protein GLYMA_06G172733v4 [Glycine max]|nr:hypothetical protein GLYMA_06G172733v4 [Glycine max]